MESADGQHHQSEENVGQHVSADAEFTHLSAVDQYNMSADGQHSHMSTVGQFKLSADEQHNHLSADGQHNPTTAVNNHATADNNHVAAVGPQVSADGQNGFENDASPNLERKTLKKVIKPDQNLINQLLAFDEVSFLIK